jgi:hypothetical protein
VQKVDDVKGLYDKLLDVYKADFKVIDLKAEKSLHEVEILR